MEKVDAQVGSGHEKPHPTQEVSTRAVRLSWELSHSLYHRTDVAVGDFLRQLSAGRSLPRPRRRSWPRPEPLIFDGAVAERNSLPHGRGRY